MRIFAVGYFATPHRIFISLFVQRTSGTEKLTQEQVNTKTEETTVSINPWNYPLNQYQRVKNITFDENMTLHWHCTLAAINRKSETIKKLQELQSMNYNICTTLHNCESWNTTSVSMETSTNPEATICSCVH